MRKSKYKGYTIEKSGFNFYVTDPTGHRAFAEVPASVKIAKKWIDMELANLQKKFVKTYYSQTNVGKSKYVVNYSDSIKTHEDGSRFYDIRIFRNKKEVASFIKELSRKGYKENIT